MVMHTNVKIYIIEKSKNNYVGLISHWTLPPPLWLLQQLTLDHYVNSLMDSTLKILTLTLTQMLKNVEEKSKNNYVGLISHWTLLPPLWLIQQLILDHYVNSLMDSTLKMCRIH
jgi:hypothetical protein